ncbi:hypothetical protein VNO78_20796 [Psophocarpus tetragonolobus]|uniref:Ribosomal RNA small subunit methyltransferase NEP1 n=1 Tax=Psophocarpus tetragonolobus TaxID=3891 RepID=A0AAN9SC27_PSOTE
MCPFLQVAAFVDKKYQILNPDEHASYLRRKYLNPYDYRPEIVQEALLQIMSSRLCMAGRLRAVFIRTDEGILIRVEPQTLIPKTLGSFCNMMGNFLYSCLYYSIIHPYSWFLSSHPCLSLLKYSINFLVELLQKFSIKSKGGHGKKLLRLIQNPVTDHLPVNSRKVGLSFSSPKAVQISDYLSDANCHENIVFVVGAMGHGKIDVDYIDDLISVSGYPLGAGTCLRRICIALERKWKIH